MSVVPRAIVAGTLLLVCAGPIGLSPAHAQMTIQGVFNGTYRCAQGMTNVKLSIITTGDNLSALFTFYSPPGTQKQGHTYSLQGTINPRTNGFTLTPVRWETAHPADVNMVGLNGLFDSDVVQGNVVATGCSTFYLERNREESSNIAAVMAAQTRVAAPLTAAVQRGSRPSAPQGATPSPSAPRGAGPRSQGPATATDPAATDKAFNDFDKTEARLKNPLLAWTSMSNKDVEARTFVRVPSDTVRVNAYCGSNGVSVKFSLQSLVSDPLRFDWYEDADDDGLIADVRVIPDNVAPHVARGHAEKKNDTTYYANNLALLFYDAVTRDRAERGALTGVRELDSLLGSIFQQTNQRIVESWLRTTAGSIASLLAARSVRVELPIEGREDKLMLDLNPQDRVLHAFAADCNAKLTGTSAPSQQAPRQTPQQPPASAAPRGASQR